MSLSVVTENRHQLHHQDAKKQLLEQLKLKDAEVTSLVEAFYAKQAYSTQDYLTFCQRVDNIMQELLQNDQDSLFLRNALKPLRDLKAQAQQILASNQEGPLPAQRISTLDSSTRRVYILLFQNDGHNLRQWALQLRAIERYALGRPVYAEQTDVEQAIRLRLSQSREAYVVCTIACDAILSDAINKRSDRYGKPLLNLSEKAVTSDCIEAFVHQGKRYQWHDGQLTLEQD